MSEVEKDIRRLFSSSQAAELLAAAGYKCQGDDCPDRDLSHGQGFECHHDKRHADGGATSIYNGRVLCLSCHRKTFAGVQDPDVGLVRSVCETNREWQNAAVARWIEVTPAQRLFVLEAAPGAGKTRFAACVSRIELDSDSSEITHVIIVVPWKPILTSMKEAIGSLRLDVREGFHYSRKMGVLQRPPDGDVTLDTYAGICNQDTVDVLRSWKQSSGFRFLLVLDEIHHTNTVSGKWGPFASEIASLADKVLVMSGTYFRSDNRMIEFLKYDPEGDPNGRPVRDYQITYSECVAERYVRQVAFRWCDAELEIAKRGEDRVRKRMLSAINSSSHKQLSVAKREVLNADGIHVEWMINEAWFELRKMRTRWPDAACLVVCQPGGQGDSEAEERAVHRIEKRIQALTGQTPVVVTSGDATSHGKLSHFRGDNSPFLCAIRMVSEGVDIPRVRMILFISYTDSEMLFRQIVGRSLRYISCAEDDSVGALVILPKFPMMVGFAERFEMEADEGKLNMKPLPQLNAGGESPSTCRQCGKTPCLCYVVIGSELVAAGGRVSASDVGEKYVERAKMIRDTSTAHQHANIVQLADALQRFDTMEQEPIQLSYQDNKALVVRNIHKLVKQLAVHKYGGNIQGAWVDEISVRYSVENFAEMSSTWRTSDLERVIQDLKATLTKEIANG